MSPRRRLPRFALWEAGSRSAAAGLGDPAPVRNPVLVFTIRQARPEDDTILGLVDAATWSDGASPAPAPPAGTAFFADRTRPDDVLVEAAVEEARDRGARKLTLRVLGGNTRARQLYDGCGFIVEGILRAEFFLDGRYVDDVLMARDLVSG